MPATIANADDVHASGLLPSACYVAMVCTDGTGVPMAKLVKMEPGKLLGMSGGGEPDVPDPVTGGASWGTVTGLLSAQTDLVAALDGKQPAGNYATGGGTATGMNTGDKTLDELSGVSTSVLNTIVNTMLGQYRTVHQASGSHIAGRVAGTYALSNGGVLATTGVGTLYPTALIHLNSSDFATINGLSPKLRVKAWIETNDVAPTGNYTVGLFPVTRPTVSGGAGLIINTIGTIVSGSGALFTTPAVDSMLTVSGADFAVPATGFYMLAVTTTATVAVSSLVHVHAHLQAHNA